MRFLLDTHTFLWLINDEQALSTKALQLVSDADNKLFLSIASPWEMAIKIRTGKFTPPKDPLNHFIRRNLQLAEVELLDINLEHVTTLTTLPLHHRDPFDRMLIAQSIVDNLPIISADAAFDAYGITRLW
ncbi:MAG: type II toxin-antitoxin system VapC family toxin [Chloroflexi bacterium]|nr:type II toxin-antitoxin system VapC family toxin [Chloroflexota bacterium]MCC6897187.1 type II toxin-antitoxin system VapC family toxin [Anaerolineae bacterium]